MDVGSTWNRGVHCCLFLLLLGGPVMNCFCCLCTWMVLEGTVYSYISLLILVLSVAEVVLWSGVMGDWFLLSVINGSVLIAMSLMVLPTDGLGRSVVDGLLLMVDVPASGMQDCLAVCDFLAAVFILNC